MNSSCKFLLLYSVFNHFTTKSHYCYLGWPVRLNNVGGEGGPGREPNGQLFSGGGSVSGEGWRNPFPRGWVMGGKGGPQF